MGKCKRVNEHVKYEMRKRINEYKYRTENVLMRTVLFASQNVVCELHFLHYSKAFEKEFVMGVLYKLYFIKVLSMTNENMNLVLCYEYLKWDLENDEIGFKH